MEKVKRNKKIKLKRKSYTFQFKKLVLQHFLKSAKPSKRATASLFRISRTQVSNWLKQKDEIMKAKKILKKRKQRKTLKTPLYPDVEKQVFEWFVEQRQNCTTVTPFLIQNKMLECLSDKYPDDALVFKASRGWLSRFMDRYNLTNRRITTSGRELPKNCVQIVKDYLKEVKETIEKEDYTLDAILAFDETSFYMDMPGAYTIEVKGKKRVKCNTTGKEKTRLSCLMTGTASGKKLPVLCVVPRKNKLDGIKLPDNSVVIYETSSTFNSSNLEDHYVERVLKPYFLQHKIEKSLIILDQAKCHLTPGFQGALEAVGCSFIYIPARLTGILQPADVNWFKSLKSKYKNEWNNWFMNAPKRHTKHGNVCGPGYQNMINWIVKGWYELTEEDIVKSFVNCGITSSTVNNYHSCLKDIVESAVVPPNLSIESKEDDEELFYGVFITDDDEDNDDDYEYESESSKSDSSDCDTIGPSELDDLSSDETISSISCDSDTDEPIVKPKKSTSKPTPKAKNTPNSNSIEKNSKSKSSKDSSKNIAPIAKSPQTKRKALSLEHGTQTQSKKNNNKDSTNNNDNNVSKPFTRNARLKKK